MKSPTFHNFADPIMHNIVVKDIFAWMSLQILATTVRKWIEIGIPAIVCSKLRQAMGRRNSNSAPSMRYSERR